MLRRSLLTAAAACGLAVAAPAGTWAQDNQRSSAEHLDRVCKLIETEARANGLPDHFFGRLLWKESRFDPGAVSPAGAEGIAQFMPATAARRGLENSFDPDLAIPASARYLADLGRQFGNLGLAAAAYNAGENRVSQWLARGGFLPLETEDFVLDITGDPVDTFADRSRQIRAHPLEDGKPFAESCRKLPVLRTATVAMATLVRKPWAIQVAGNFRRSAAINAWERIRRANAAVVKDLPVAVSRVRTPMGRRGIYAVRLGADSRADADRICNRLRSSGGACVVMKNR